MSAVQRAAARRMQPRMMDFNNKAKLDPKQVRDQRKGTLLNLLIPGGSNVSGNNNFANYTPRKKFKRNDQA